MSTLKSAEEWLTLGGVFRYALPQDHQNIRAIQANCFRAAAEIAKLNHADSEKGIIDSLVDKLNDAAQKLEAKA